MSATAATPTADGRPAPLRVAIVGSGPAGFYVAGALLDAVPGCTIDMLDRLPTPWGLVRAGVAPDHPRIKAVARVYERTARRPGFRFHGGVEVGADLTHAELAAGHHAVVYAIGAADDRRLGIPGEQLPGSLSATAFVGWYNGHPDHAALAPDLSCGRAVVIGNGNVALDVARMLVLGERALAGTDVADHALAALARSRIEEVVVLGRRGPAQATFTTPELRELGELDGVDLDVDPREAAIDAASRAAIDADVANQAPRDNVELLAEYARRRPTGAPRRIALRFLRAPLELLGAACVERVRIARTALDAELRAHPTGERELLDAGLVIRAVGSRARPPAGLPADPQSGTLVNDGARVLDPATRAPLPGVYAAGWVKRGPSGTIGTNRRCAQETVAALLADHAAERLPAPADDAPALDALIAARVARPVDYAAWERIDAHERAAGEPAGRPRVKVADRDRLLALAAGERPPTTAAPRGGAPRCPT